MKFSYVDDYFSILTEETLRHWIHLKRPKFKSEKYEVGKVVIHNEIFSFFSITDVKVKSKRELFYDRNKWKEWTSFDQSVTIGRDQFV